MKIGAVPHVEDMAGKVILWAGDGHGLALEPEELCAERHGCSVEAPLIQQHCLLALQPQQSKGATRSVVVDKVIAQNCWEGIEDQGLPLTAV